MNQTSTLNQAAAASEISHARISPIRAHGGGFRELVGRAALWLGLVLAFAAPAFGDGVVQNDGSGTTWRAADAGRLTVFMIDHGYKTDGFMAFRLNPTQAVSADDFARWMDQAQTDNPSLDLQLVVDCCFSGGFIAPLLNNAAFAARRVLLASAAPDQEAMFVPPPDLTSFMFNFLSSAYMGNSFGEAWRASGRFFRAFPVSAQAPVIWDGSTLIAIDDELTTLTLADKTFFGRSWAYGVQSRKDVNQFFPAFDETDPLTIVPLAQPNRTPPTVFPGESFFKIVAHMARFERPQQVIVAVRPPAPTVVTGEPVTALPRVALTLERDEATTAGQIWSAVLDTAPTTATFHNDGDYRISASARFDQNRVSNPEFATVLVSEGLDPDSIPIRSVILVGQGPDPAQSQSMAVLGAQSYDVSVNRFRNQDGAPHPDWIEYFTPTAGTNRDYPQTDKTRLLQTLRGEVFNEDSVTTPVGRLYVHLIGPSASDADTPSTPALVLAGNGATTLTLDVLEVKSALDAFQARPVHHGVLAREVFVLLDMPHAGTWLAPLAGAHRTVICSGRAEDTGLFVPGVERTGTFSGRFMLAAATGADLRESFRAAQNFFRAFTTQAPIYDDTGDGIFGNELWSWRWNSIYGDPTLVGVAQDGTLSRERWWGRRYAFAGDESGLVPFVLSVEPTSQTLNAGQIATLSATLLEGVAPVSVVARLLPPHAARSGSGAGLLEINMTTATLPVNWTASFPAPAEPGEWKIAVVARYADGMTSEGQVLLRDSEPATATLTVLGGPAPDTFDALFAEDGTTGILNRIPVNVEQRHNFDGAGDEDWFAFYVTSQTPHSLHIYDQQADANVLLEIYLNGLNQPPLIVNDGLDGPGEYELVTLPLVTQGTIYARARNVIRGGLQTGYTLLVSRDVGPNIGVPTVGYHSASIGPNGGGIPGNSPASRPMLALETPPIEHYDQVRITFPSNALTLDSMVYLSGVFSISQTLDGQAGISPWFEAAFKAWHEVPISAANFTPIDLTITPRPANGHLNQPLTVRMQFLENVTIKMPDESSQIGHDLPGGASPNQAQLWVWIPDLVDASKGTWQVLSPAIGDPPIIDGNLASFTIPADQMNFFAREATGNVILGLAPTARNATRDWLLYQ